MAALTKSTKELFVCNRRKNYLLKEVAQLASKKKKSSEEQEEKVLTEEEMHDEFIRLMKSGEYATTVRNAKASIFIVKELKNPC